MFTQKKIQIHKQDTFEIAFSEHRGSSMSKNLGRFLNGQNFERD